MWWPFERKPQFRQHYLPDRGLTHASRLTESLDGLVWHRAPLPPRNHLCWPQTKVYSRARVATFRCACGAWSMDAHFWVNRNIRRRRRGS